MAPRNQRPPTLVLVALAAMMCAAMAPLANAYAYGCPRGQVHDDYKGRCAQCPVGSVKWPDEDGAEDASCESARDVCGSAEVAKYGSCYKCPASQVAADDVKCVNCPPGYLKVPSGVVSDASCKSRGIVPPKCVPQTEVCNGKDDDCDGSVDEGIPDLYCTPCNRKVPACYNGRPNTCAGVCPQPCCEDCADYSDPRAMLSCYSSCQNCRDLDSCLGWADSVGDKVAQVSCERAATYCGIPPTAGLRALDGGRQVTIEQCYEAAYDQCTSRAEYFFEHDTSTACRYYYLGGGHCSPAEFQAKAEGYLEEICDDIAVGIAVSLP